MKKRKLAMSALLALALSGAIVGGAHVSLADGSDPPQICFQEETGDACNIGSGSQTEQLNEDGEFWDEVSELEAQ